MRQFIFMQRRPFNHVAEHARRQFALDDRRMPDGNLRGELVYIAWKCGGRCSSRYIRIEMPRKRLISGMDGLRVLIQQRLRLLAGHL